MHTEAYIDGIWYTISRSRMTYNLQGKRTSLENLAGQVTTTARDCCHKVSETQPDGSATTWDYDAEGRMIAASRLVLLDMTNVTWLTTCYKYDDLGRQTATWPTNYATQVYRAEGSMAGDTTTWSYDEATGLLVAKTYADGKGPTYTYTPNGSLATRTWARRTSDGDTLVTTYSYDGWNNLINTVYSDGTPSISLTYDAMGRQVSATDAAGTTATTYDDYGEVISEATTGLYNKTLARHRDAFGRDLGYTIDNSRMSIVEYEADTARMKRVKMAGVWFTYHYLLGTDLKSRLQYGGLGSAYYTYEPNRDLLTQVQNYINGGVVSQYDYVNDAAGRRTAITRSGSMMSETRTDHYGYNDRSELVSGTKDTAATNLTEYAYQYDDIGNRLSSLDIGTNRTYTANALNQYTNIVEGVGEFLPQFDDDGNQTLIKTATGIWQITYNGENRPVLWECGSTNIVMKFDRMGRRVEYVETVSGVINTHHRFVYDGYLCIQRLNGAANNAIDLVFGWDPSEPVATRPLILQKYGQYNLFYTHDMRPRRRRRVARRSVATAPRSGRKRPRNKNVSELVFFQQANGIAAHYEYAPFGAVTAASRSTPVTAYDFREYNPFRFSSEYADITFNLIYYNYRHYWLSRGRWVNHDSLNEVGEITMSKHINRFLLNTYRVKKASIDNSPLNEYAYCLNNALISFDWLGKCDFIDDLVMRAPWNDYHGNYCGAKRVNGDLLSAGQDGMSPDDIGIVDPVDELDRCCLKHDRCLARIDMNKSLSPRDRNLAIKTCDSEIAGCWIKALFTAKNVSCWTRVKGIVGAAIMPAFAHILNPVPMDLRDDSVAIGILGFSF